MAFCSKGIRAAKNTLHKLDDVLEPIIDDVLTFTGNIKNNAAWPVIEAAVLALPGGAMAEKAINTALNALSAIHEIEKEPDPLKKIKWFMEEISTFDFYKRNALLIKMASIITAILHEMQHTESEYDSLVQLKVIAHNGEKKN